MVVIESHQTEYLDTGRIKTQQSKKHSKTHLANFFQSLLFAQARVLRQLVCHANPLLRLHLSAKVEGFDTKVVGMDSSVVDVRFRVLSTAGFDSLEDFIPYQEWPMLRLNIMASMLHAEHDTDLKKLEEELNEALRGSEDSRIALSDLKEENEAALEELQAGIQNV